MPDPNRRPRRRQRPELTRGEAIAALAAIALFAVTFASWYGSEVSGQAREIKLGGGAGAGGNAWQTLEVIPLVLLLTVVVTVGAVALRLSGSKWKPAIPPSAAVAVLGGLSALLVLFRIVAPPDLGELGGVQLNAKVELGAFLGLIAAAGVAYGGYRAMGQRDISFAGVADDLASASRKDRQRLRRKRAGKPKSSRSPRPAKLASRRRSQSSSD
jgi:hypothetical protein